MFSLADGKPTEIEKLMSMTVDVFYQYLIADAKRAKAVEKFKKQSEKQNGPRKTSKV